MRALRIHETTGPDALRIEDVPEPEAGPDQVLIDVHAAGVGFVDLLVTKGEYQLRPDPPFIPGIEVAGVVREAPEGSGFAPGDRVVAAAMFAAWAEVAAAPVTMTLPIPDGMSFETAAAALVNFQTAHLAMVRRGRVAAGEAVLVHGAAGGVGVAAIQVAKAAGATLVVASASTEEKRELALGHGADVAIDASGAWEDELKAALGDRRGVDAVVDPVGGTDLLKRSLRVMAPEARFLVIGFAAGEIAELGVNRLLLRSHDVVGVNWGGLIPFDPGYPARAWADLVGWFEQGLIDPPVGRTVPLADAASVLHDLAGRRPVVKPVLLVR